MTRREKLVEEIVEAQRTLLRELYTAAIPEWLQLELSMAQIKGLFVLHVSGPISVSGFAEQLGVSLPTASILADKLVQANMAQRCEGVDDRRRTIVTLTDEGEELITRLRQGGSDVLHHWLDQLDDEAIEGLAKGSLPLALAAISARINAEPVELGEK